METFPNIIKHPTGKCFKQTCNKDLVIDIFGCKYVNVSYFNCGCFVLDQCMIKKTQIVVALIQLSYSQSSLIHRSPISLKIPIFPCLWLLHVITRLFSSSQVKVCVSMLHILELMTRHSQIRNLSEMRLKEHCKNVQFKNRQASRKRKYEKHAFRTYSFFKLYCRYLHLKVSNKIPNCF